jgi:hypothetical protein
MIEPLQFTLAEKATYRATYAPTATNDQWQLFINECQRRALVPGVHVIFQLRSAKEWNTDLKANVSVQKVTLITTINALRLIADRSGKYEGHGPFVYYYGNESGAFDESKIPTGKIPHAVSVEGFRKDWKVPLFATARYAAYCQTKDDAGKKRPTMMWELRGEEQLAKCCEAMMLRTVAPEECAGLLITEELGNDTPQPEEPVTTTEVVTVVIPQSTVAPKVNQDPAGWTLMEPQSQTISPVSTVPVPEPSVPVVADVPASAPQEAPLVAYETALSANPPMIKTGFLEGPIEPSKDAPVTAKEFEGFIGRASKIIRDKLQKAAGMKDAEASNGGKNYLLKQSGKSGLKQISPAVFERLLKALEDATPEEAANIVRNQSQ